MSNIFINTAQDTAEQQNLEINAEDLHTQLTEFNTSAKRFLNDTSKNKELYFRDLSKRSATAKKILKCIEDDQSAVQFNLISTVNFLKLLSDIHDNNVNE
ncbi:hypothetical protein AhnVgp078 [Adoxophyes honmai nucleopolyhedrovirus]|uniref:P12 n=1 Tax=Adoxophyes honmai nucleopolyhedrovirus TaxID=224399 RepID=Q80LL8_NPVAH|nr:hypothetical protein AhnVgp078 [Adoxophyes honmai nucleopolyhedrovirus]BAC67329.1 hypothetical protein [Adoxophyes honmai nucleopolyhedrovirus]